MTLKGMLNGKNHVSFKADTKAPVVPVSILIVDGSVARMGRSRRMGIGIFSVSAIDTIVHVSSKSEEETLDWLFDTRRVSFGKLMKYRGRTSRTITAIASAASPISFDVILPMLAKDNGILGSVDRVSIHLQIVKLIQLFAFAVAPVRPSIKILELATREMTDGLFSISSCTGTNGIDGKKSIINRQRIRIKREIRIPNGSNRTDVGHGEAMVVEDVKDSCRSMKLVLVKSMAKFSGIEAFFGGKSDWKGSLITRVFKARRAASASA